MAKSAMHKKGSAVREELMGKAMASKMATTVYNDPLMEGFADWTREAVFGLLWTRPGLDLKTRALITVITDTSTAAWPELRIHLRMARNQGWTEAELGEALLHTAGYIGAPSVREALLVAREVFEEMRAEA
ncbi:carboxymuconolactone decarboxylase family protein [Paeniroseomonas aquatica]|uniref:Carboxymuconolactone decarboxylase family protein n=1 Tax=Paeniroseomonas aquatica TaxID=373043 RepID=A0ABT8ABU9_9PROT|nr:carboxymuconolactone decarboxylase family protein [Paeniroseomonas aquatica]MDN3567155.1 carboxymuconolactone decarboxylase family protein [Paeniroseomonas aquatica]